MHKNIPPIQKYMSTGIQTIQANKSVAEAHKVMAQHGIRHLPVMKGEEFVGIISDRDIRLLESFQGVDPEKALVQDIVHKDTYSVGPDAPLDDVVREMGSHKYGSTVIMQNGKVVGIFTTVDAMKAFADTLEILLKK